jgi:hypothetical protein
VINRRWLVVLATVFCYLLDNVYDSANEAGCVSSLCTTPVKFKRKPWTRAGRNRIVGDIADRKCDQWSAGSDSSAIGLRSHGISVVRSSLIGKQRYLSGRQLVTERFAAGDEQATRWDRTSAAFTHHLSHRHCADLRLYRRDDLADGRAAAE